MSEHSITEKILTQYLTTPGSPAQGIVEFRDTGDISHIDALPESLYLSVCRKITHAACDEWETTATSIAVIQSVVRRIVKTNGYKVDNLAYELANYLVAFANMDDDLQVKLVNYVKEQNGDDVDIAVFWAIGCTYNRHSFFRQSAVRPRFSHWSQFDKFKANSDVKAQNVFEEIILEFNDTDVLRFMHSYKGVAKHEWILYWGIGSYQAIIARDQPEVFKEYLTSVKGAEGSVDWRYIVGSTDQFDKECLEACEALNDIESLVILDYFRDGIYKDWLISLLEKQACDTTFHALDYLALQAPELMVKKLAQCMQSEDFDGLGSVVKEFHFSTAAKLWDQGGKQVFERFSYESIYNEQSNYRNNNNKVIIEGAIASAMNNAGIAGWINDVFASDPANRTSYYRAWEEIAQKHPSVLEPQLWVLLKSKRKSSRKLAIDGLIHPSINNPVTNAIEQLSDKLSDVRLGAIELLTAIGTDDAGVALQAALKQKQSAKIRKELEKSLSVLGVVTENDVHDGTATGQSERSLSEVIVKIDQAKTAQLPKSAKWLDLASLPTLETTEGNALPENAMLHLISWQAKHKPIGVADENRALVSYIDRNKSGDFAIAIFNQWFASSQQASDRWVLALAGTLGDIRILPLLSDPIQQWAEASRHKLAEYAAQAVALVPADESLMILDSLANRYRSRYRNIGKACNAALEQAAQVQGVSMDELADMIVPTLDFNSDYQRKLPDTEIVTVLQPDFKLTFFNPSSESETKSPPKSLPSSAVEEIKTLRKLIRETIKGQTMRLEQALVRQRAWPRKRWQELFEVNPFLQSYAARLVWCTLDAKGATQKVFRRYSNGLLANATGDVIELDDKDAHIVMVHPLNLDKAGINAWLEHFSRLKIKPPFPQLERPVATLDKKLSNRKTIGITDQHKMPNGTFRSRAERLGWVRGSVVDAGGITSYIKHFPGAQVTVFLMIEFMYIGQDPMEPVELNHTLFVKGDTVKVGSYIYDEPQDSDDPRVLSFADVPPVVYSETITDLNTITAESKE